MTPEDALSVLAQATADLPTTRQNHQTILTALDVLAAAIAPKKEK